MSIDHARVVGDKRLWLDPEVEAFVHILENGHPTLGWEGDPQLALFRIDRNRWEIARLENGRYNTVCRSKPNAKLDLGIIIHLIEMDSQRKTHLKLLEEMDKHNAAVQAREDDKGYDAIMAQVEKVYWGAKRDVGHHY